MKTIFKDFNQNFFSKSKNITWFDKEGFYTLDENRVVRITIDDVGTRDHFNGYLVEILNKLEGVIVKKFFRFEHHLIMIHNHRTDYYHVWYNNDKLDWYISRPKDTKEMCKKIFEWVEIFK
jgi:hypothetical protein